MRVALLISCSENSWSPRFFSQVDKIYSDLEGIQIHPWTNFLKVTAELTGTSAKHPPKQTKLQCTNLTQSNPFTYGNLNSSLFPTLERLLLFTTNCQNVRRDMCLREYDWVQLCPAPPESTKPTDSSGLYVKAEVKGFSAQQGTLLSPFKWPWYTMLSTERAKLISHCVDAQEQNVELLGMRRKKLPPHPEHLYLYFRVTCNS